MSIGFKQLMLWMVLITLLVFFVGINTFFLMYEQVDTFERKRIHTAQSIVKLGLIEEVGVTCDSNDCPVNL